MRMRFLVYLAGGYVVLAVLAFLLADSLVFFPHRELRTDPSERGLEYEDVSFRAGDGTLLHGWFLPGKGRGTLLFCHGNAGNISHRLDSLEIFHRLGLSVFLFDYRGYGISEGKPSEEGVYSDVEGAWRWLTEERGIRPEAIVLFGRSLGGAAAAWAAQKYSPAGLILESTFTSLADIGKHHYFFLPVKLIVGNSFDTLGKMKNISCPVLVAASPEDEIVPGEQGQILFEAARPPKRFLQLKGDHNWGFMSTGRAYVQGLDTFLDEVFGSEARRNEVE
ncbi:alpha/beta hydrolase [Aminivibrio sp.]|jgi:fermentation-respiration switch protein FrsA (DUF1100 family)|uniref:alpha/beta hydrolase n=1 Tax=Aminivibrio sp. TaxID=1872489 RepID=UPI0016963F8D|nr:alpha/beta hydrolase [Synergistaceae bacterium]NCC57175.1 alpha/beta hydrolase [Synergistales bacterium]NLO57506.1 alpha/beta hydrolase [Synergistaceae bacterium]